MIFIELRVVSKNNFEWKCTLIHMRHIHYAGKRFKQEK